ncbi:hypothetical protein [Homoserinibacter sp. YIM 151385]|uniref:hypothetical protein n=1 Tax=Homoserinibacter sp. YIM 151385 TaxID=2985506 RepID=UPI0022F0BD2D|nr:hypothetical protein [Homoserinibacter sp. YIM 151385]WBU36990.1 hypothetical protein OF852_08625 [Homoserinibacter sp. YIM 151385]
MAEVAGGPSGAVAVAGSLWSVPEDARIDAVRALAERGMRRLHWDMTDGRFAVAGGFDPAAAARIAETTGMTGEAHLMAEEPLAIVDAWAEVCDTVVVHAESTGWRTAVDRLEQRGCRAAIAVSLATPAAAVPSWLPVMCMSIVPGQAGSAFDRRVLAKVAELREAGGPGRPIGLDGGVTRAIADDAIAAGADWLVVGTDLFAAGGADRWADLLG